MFSVLLREGKGEPEALGGEAVGFFLLKILRGASLGSWGGGRGLECVCGEFGRGGSQCVFLFFSTLKFPPSCTKKQFYLPVITVGFLYGPGAETLIFVTGTSGKYPKMFVSRQKIQSQLWIPGKPRKIGVWVSGAPNLSGGYQNCGLGIHR